MPGTKIFIDGYYYLPFWVVQEYLDVDPPDPFVKCKVIRLTQMNLAGDTGLAHLDTCEVELPTGIAPNVPQSYLITKENLQEWAQRFAEWFITFAETESQL